MGYFTPFVAPSGKDGGVDILAYRDPLGTIFAPNKSSNQASRVIRQPSGSPAIDGIASEGRRCGIFISSGGFTPDAKTTARNSNVHVDLLIATLRNIVAGVLSEINGRRQSHAALDADLSLGDHYLRCGEAYAIPAKVSPGPQAPSRDRIDARPSGASAAKGQA